MASTDAKHIPVKNAAYRLTFPIFDADGDLVTGATGLDSEVSIDGGTFADCTNEATEIATSSGMYYLDLTAAEMNGDTIAVIVKTSSSGAKTTPIVLYTAARSVNDLAYPTVSGRSLDVSAGGEAGVDWANVGSPTTTVNLSGTTVKTATDVETDTQDIQGRLPAALTGSGSIKAALQNEAQGGAAAVLTLERIVVASATTNEPAVKLTGNGTGAGLSATGGATGNGIQANGGATSGAGLYGRAVAGNSHGLRLEGVGIGDGINAKGGATGNGLKGIGGATSGLGLYAISQGGNYPGAHIEGNGTGAGLSVVGGDNGPGLYASGGLSQGSGARFEGVAENAHGVEIIGLGTGDGLNIAGGLSGHDVNADIQGSLSGTVGGISGTLQTLDALWTKIKKWLQLGFRKDAAIATDNATELTEINANGGSGAGAFANTTDSLEAARDSVDTQLTTIDDFLDTEIAAIKAKTDNLPADPADASDIAALFVTVNSKLDAIDDFLDTEIAAILADTTELADTVLADSVPADGSLGTIKQTLYEIRQFLFEFSISSTTGTSKKADGSTTLETFTTNSATTPTSITRSG